MKVAKDKKGKSIYRAMTREDNDCTVIALAKLAGTPYPEAHKLLEDRGRERRKPFYMGELVNVLAEVCSSVEYLGRPVKSDGSGYTPITIGGRYPLGRYLCCTKDHVFALINGEVKDWCKSKRLRITKIYEVK